MALDSLIQAHPFLLGPNPFLHNQLHPTLKTGTRLASLLQSPSGHLTSVLPPSQGGDWVCVLIVCAPLYLLNNRDNAWELSLCWAMPTAHFTFAELHEANFGYSVSLLFPDLCSSDTLALLFSVLEEQGSFSRHG